MSDFKLVKLLDTLNNIVITGGLVPKGDYDNGTDYTVGDLVTYNNSSYVMYVDAAAGTLPTDTTKWQMVANGHEPVTVTDSAEIDFTLTDQDITASLVAGSIDETKLDTSVNASLDLADSATQPGDLADVATSGLHSDLTLDDGSNPHNTTKSDVGLGNVDNTSDTDKPVSTATQTALDGKVDENVAIVGATKTKITYDAKGLVTG